ncbi:MAG TPA: oligosaccharide flippase family protein [Geminicoccaceae bacterium]|nr:oligosaccharide flippase family protein [Geminicoccaceae bacterium]
MTGIRARIVRLLPKGRFLRRFTMLSGGQVLAQLLVLASSPILTRVYTPAEFGVYGVFTALTGILGNVLSLRYETAVPLARTGREAAGLVTLSVLLTVVFSALCVPAVWLGGARLASLTGMPALASLLWVLPPTIIALGTAQVLSYWTVYRGTFRLNAASRLGQGAAQVGLQIGLGAAGLGAAGLVLGYGLAYVTRAVHFLAMMARPDRALFRDPDLAAIAGLARTHRRYAFYSAPATLLEASTQLLPALLLAVIYGPVVAGLFSLGQRLMGLPVRLVAQAASQVFLGEVAQRDRGGLYRLFKRATLRFPVLGLVGMVPLLLTAPALFAFVFGEPWRPAGGMVQALVPLYLTRFVVTPVSQTLNVLGRQNLHLLSSSVDAALMLTCFGAAWWLVLAPLETVLLFSLGSTLAYVLYFALAWRAARDQADAASASAAPHDKESLLG